LGRVADILNMNNGFLERKFAAANRRTLLLAVLLIGAAIASASFGMRFLRNGFRGPVPISSEALQGVTDARALDDYFVTVTGEENLDSGVTYIEESRSGSKTTEAYYHFLVVGERLLLVKIPAASDTREALEQTGWLVPVPSQEQVEIVNQLDLREPGLKDIVLPVMLDGNQDRFSLFALCALIAAAALLGLYLLARWILTLGNSTKLIAKDLGRYGEPRQLIPQIEAEIPEGFKGDNILTRNWVIRATNFKPAARKLEDVVWAYRFTMAHRTYGIVTSKMHSVYLFDRDGKRIEVAFARHEAQADAFMQKLVDNAPWVIAGHSDELENAFKKDRPGFLKVVADRKLQVGRV
jgi:hypothetical protein